jgi:hypothetical protein
MTQPNTVIIDDRSYNVESLWRKSIKSLKKDINGNIYPFPKEENIWSAQYDFIKYFKYINKHLKLKNKFSKYAKFKKCLLCNEKNVTTGMFMYKNYIWEDGLIHYISIHNIVPSKDFIDFIYSQKFEKEVPYLFRYKGKIYKRDKLDHIQISRNQLNILDALMRHGGYTKRYVDKQKKIYRYSEHMGVLDFENNKLYKIIVSGETNRIDKNDKEIYFPNDLSNLPEYEYMFHTHPPTPKPGGRAKDGILYEFPSIGDILHFIYNYNIGHTVGSLVVTPEGLYNVRKLFFDNKKIKINENTLFKNYSEVFGEIQTDALLLYGIDFTTIQFYSQISQDVQFINKLNELLNEFDINIDFFPRKQDEKKNWILDTIYLPVYNNKIIS